MAFGREPVGSFRIFIGLYEGDGRKLSVFPDRDRLAFAYACYKYVHGDGDGCGGGGVLFCVVGLSELEIGAVRDKMTKEYMALVLTVKILI